MPKSMRGCWPVVFTAIALCAMTAIAAPAPGGGNLAPCTGDCDGDGRVTIAELVRVVRLALGLAAAACDGFGPNSTVDALVRAVNRSLLGCDSVDPTAAPTATPTTPARSTPTATPTSTGGRFDFTPTATFTATNVFDFTPTPTCTVEVGTEGVDLLVTLIGRERCKDPSQCRPLPDSAVTVCVGNRGALTSAPASVEVNGTVTNVGALAGGGEACFFRLIDGFTAITVEVDPDQRIAEADENNNFASQPALDPTACDVVGPPCHKTPTPAPTDRCEDCCDHCTDAACVEECVGVEECTLVADWQGTVTDATTGEPIANAEVTVNGVSGRSDADGQYLFRSTRREVCSGLDYLHQIAVTAPGFEELAESFYRTPAGEPTERDVALERQSEVERAMRNVLDSSCHPFGIISWQGVWFTETAIELDCAESPGHESHATLTRYAGTGAAETAFLDLFDGSWQEQTLYGYPARFSERSQNGVSFFYEDLIWLADCWVMHLRSFDDTSYTYISPQPHDLAEAIHSIALDALLAQCGGTGPTV